MSYSELNEKPSFAQLKRFVKERAKSAETFSLALDHFGLEPGDTWAELVGDFYKNFKTLAEALGILDARLSLPGAELKESIKIVRESSKRLDELKKAIRYQIQTNIEPISFSTAPSSIAKATWDAYDASIKNTGFTMYRRPLMQALINRSHDPASLIPLFFTDHPYSGPYEMMDFMPNFVNLVRHTPLKSLGGKTIAQKAVDDRRSFFEELRTGKAGPDMPFTFEEFVEVFSGTDPIAKNAAHSALKKINDKHHEENWGNMPESQWTYYRQALMLWDGVKASMDHHDPHYRRSALAILPHFLFSRVLTDLADEVLPFILKGLQDPHGHVRYKIVRFAETFYHWVLEDQPEELGSFEKNLALNRKRYPRGSPEWKSHNQLIRFIAEIKERRTYLELTRGLSNLQPQSLEDE